VMEKVRPKKALGQNFLTDRNVLSRIARLLDRGTDARILEVGPWKGALTRILAENGARVLAIELDRQLVPLLEKEFSGSGNVKVLQADILRIDLPTVLREHWAGKWEVAANLPYNISSQVLFRFMERRAFFPARADAPEGGGGAARRASRLKGIRDSVGSVPASIRHHP